MLAVVEALAHELAEERGGLGCGGGVDFHLHGLVAADGDAGVVDAACVGVEQDHRADGACFGVDQARDGLFWALLGAGLLLLLGLGLFLPALLGASARAAGQAHAQGNCGDERCESLQVIASTKLDVNLSDSIV